ncbi:MAG: ATP-binding protein [Puniceicoccaceae bacterium]|nr:MAG: ATP-binding protein [Puniceicoccaceae bacterium]
MWVSRKQEQRLLEGVATRPVVVITGARQTGKTSLVRHLFPDHQYVSLDLPSTAAQAELEPSTFLSRHKTPLIIDEMQYAPALLRYLKIAVDAHRQRNGQFILTGSQPFELMAGVAESLAGRAVIMQLDGLSYDELSHAKLAPPVDAYLLRGSYPELYEKPDLNATSFYQSYVATYLERDLRSQLRVGSLRDFERFLRACALRTAQVLNKAIIARDVGISPSTAAEWLSALERSGIIALLEPWFSNATKSLVKAPKLHFLDTGLCAFLLGMNTIEDLYESPLKGALWETAIYAELRKQLSLAPTWQLYYWRDRSKEADFLLHKAGRFKIGDAKWSETPANSGKLNKVRAELPETTQAFLCCRSPQSYPLSDSIQAISFADTQNVLK